MLDEQTGELTSGANPTRRGSDNLRDAYGDFKGQAECEPARGADTGGASRFFLTAPHDTLCVLCQTLCVESAGNPSSPSGPVNGTAAGRVPGELQPLDEASSPGSAGPAKDAARSSSTTPPTVPDDSAPPSASTELADWIVRHARSAVPLCETCATATARSVAQWLRAPTPALRPGAASTSGPRLRTLSQSLALAAAGARSTGIIPTTESLHALCGSAAAATTASTTASATAADGDRTPLRFRYTSKPDDGERNAGLGDVVSLFAPADAPGRNDHPTVKPITLMRWLCRLVTPPGGLVLDPFCGSGTTGCAAALEGFAFIGIEREEAYAAIARARLAHWSLGEAA
jgi:hypothetical protein